MKLQKIIHPIYTAKVTTSTNAVSFDVRPRSDYLNRVVLKFRVMRPEQLIKKGANILFCSPQNDRVFPNSQEAHKYLMDKVINYL